ncbi:peptidyl-prolyl cis-trans isomerase [Clostridium tertium]|uniref:peptidyl-prolyl cis-trans isomerase n=1 Tax=Clostridium tertium TaxID=1559 RepID=UPI0023B28267|nr:peptidyl-prolyl cis-trans isomerase [Clostridium tertium]
MKKRRIALLLASILMLSILGGCSKLGAKDGNVVESGRVIITQQDLANKMKDIDEQLTTVYGPDYKDVKEAKKLYNEQIDTVLESLITERILKVKAAELELTPTDEQIADKENETYKTLKSVYGKSDMDSDTFIQELGYTSEEYREMIVDQIIYEAVGNYIRKDLDEITEDEARKYFEDNKDLFKISKGMEVSQIEFKTEEDANKGFEELKNGANFVDVIAAYNPEAIDSAGYIGFIEFNSSQVDKTYMEVIKKLKEGEVSQPIITSYGIHIIKALKSREESYREFDEMKESLINQLNIQQESDAFDDKIAEWKEELGIKVNEKNINKL